jgi:hypothetical protein
MDIRVEPILYEQKSVFIQMLELYQYDFSEFSNDDINEICLLKNLGVKLLQRIQMENIIRLQQWKHMK